MLWKFIIIHERTTGKVNGARLHDKSISKKKVLKYIMCALQATSCRDLSFFYNIPQLPNPKKTDRTQRVIIYRILCVCTVLQVSYIYDNMYTSIRGRVINPYILHDTITVYGLSGLLHCIFTHSFLGKVTLQTGIYTT